MPEFLETIACDDRLSWPRGRTVKLIFAGKLPHVQLPDGAIRVEWSEIASLIRHTPTRQDAKVSND